MPAPFQYNTGLQSPADTLVNSINATSGIQQVAQQRQNFEQQAVENTQQQQLFAQQQAAGQQQAQAQQAMQADIQGLGQNPSAASLARLSAKYPEMSEKFKKTYDMLSETEKKERVSQATNVYAAISSGNSEMAQQILADQAEAYRNSGLPKDAKVLEDMATLVKTSPEAAKTSAGLFLASVDPDKFTENFTKYEGEQRAKARAPAELSKAQSEAKSAAISAKYAESDAVADLHKKGLDAQKIGEDIKINKKNVEIAALNAATAKEKNAIKREEMAAKAKTAEKERDVLVRGKAADLESARNNADGILDTADEILKIYNDDDSTVRAALGGLDSRLPTLLDSTNDFEALVENLTSQIFLSQAHKMRGLGALTQTEGARLETALKSISLKQSPEQFIKNVKAIQTLTIKGRDYLATEYGVENTVPETPNAGQDPVEIEDLINKYSGAQ